MRGEKGNDMLLKQLRALTALFLLMAIISTFAYIFAGVNQSSDLLFNWNVRYSIVVPSGLGTLVGITVLILAISTWLGGLYLALIEKKWGWLVLILASGTIGAIFFIFQNKALYELPPWVS
jgi:hypothetical protein